MPTTKHSLTRIARLVAMMRENRYPSYPKLLREMRKLDVAGTFKLSQKTVQRDVNFLKSEYNAPIKYSPVQRGYYLTNPDWTWECPLLEPDEMKASLLGARLAETIFPEPIRGKIRKAVDRQLMNNEKGLDENIALESLVATISRQSRIDPEIFAIVFTAWEKHRTLRVDYISLGFSETKNFTIEPHVLSLYDGCWYIKGKMIAKGDWNCAKWNYPDMILALPRIKKAELLNTTFETDERLVAEVEKGRLFNMEEIHNITLKIEGITTTYIKEQFQEEDYTEDQDGSITLHISNAVKLPLVKWILGEGGNITVLAPKSLREEICAHAERIFERMKSN